jgi:hypothetical protein
MQRFLQTLQIIFFLSIASFVAKGQSFTINSNQLSDTLCEGTELILTPTNDFGADWQEWFSSHTQFGLGISGNLLLILDSPGVLTITITGGSLNGVNGSGSRTFYVVAKEYSTFYDTICNGDTYLFNGQSLTTSGLYYDTLQNQLGCDSFITLNLYVYQPTTSVLAMSATICDGDTTSLKIKYTLPYCYEPADPKLFSLDDFSISKVTLGSINNITTYPNSGGYTLYPPTPNTTTTLTAGNTYTISLRVGTAPYFNYIAAWIDLNEDGIFSTNEKIAQSLLLSANGNYNAVFTLPQNTLNGSKRMRVIARYNTQNITTCNTEAFRGEVEDYTVTIVGGANPAPSFTWAPSTSTSLPITNEVKAFPAVTTTYTVTGTNTNGCTNTATVNVVVNMRNRPIIYDTICAGTSLSFNNNNLNTAGTYYDTLVNSNGCDTIVTLNLFVKQTSYFTFSDTICGGTSYNFNGQSLIATGNYYDTLVNAVGCDSIVTLNLFVTPHIQLHANASSDTICKGNPFSLISINSITGFVGSFNPAQGTFYTSGSFTTGGYNFSNTPNSVTMIPSNNYSNTNLSSSGSSYWQCDTITQSGTINFDWNYSTFSHPSLDYVDYSINGVFNFLNGYDIWGAQNQTGTQSITVNAGDVITFRIHTNDNDYGTSTVVFNNFSFTPDSSLTYLWSGNGLINTTTNIVNAVLNIPGTQTYTVTASDNFGCTNSATIGVLVNSPSASIITDTICAGTYTLAGQILTASGTYYDTLTNAVGCDSIITLNLTILPITNYTYTDTICSNYPYFFNGQSLNSSGTYYDTLVNANGCDSMVTLDLFVKEPSNFAYTDTICVGSQYSFNGQNLNATGTYYDTLINDIGCDSIITLNLYISSEQAPIIVSAATKDTVCQGNAVVLTAVNTNTYVDIGFVGPFDSSKVSFTTSGLFTNGGYKYTEGFGSKFILLTSGHGYGPGSGFGYFSTDTFTKAGTINLNWTFSHSNSANASGDYVRFTINNGTYNHFNGFIVNGASYQNGAETINVNAGDVLTFEIYTADNDIFPCTILLNNVTFTPTILPSVNYLWTGNNLSNANNDTANASLTLSGIQTYTVVGTDNIGCTNSSTVSVYSQAFSSQIVSLTTSQTQTQADGSQLTYTNNNCAVIAGVVDAVSGNLLGNTTAIVTIDSTTPSYNGQPYCRRHYDITPASQGAAIVTIYATQADFDDYNIAATANALPLLPTEPTDASGYKQNVRVTQVHGTGGLGSGVAELKTPTSVLWNTSLDAWVITLFIDSFSGFYIHTGSANPLAINLTSFNGLTKDGNDVLNWTTSSETNNDYFELLYSTDEINYSKISTIASKAHNGNSSTPLNYEFTNFNAKEGNNYYKLKMVDKSGKISMSKIIKLYHQPKGNAVYVSPNPFTNNLNVTIDALQNDDIAITVMDATGKLIQMSNLVIKQGKNKINLDTNNWASGIYFVNVKDSQGATTIIKVTKI